ncbi:ATPase [Coemansia sp. RSA 2336]|nr:ATPase [Coemansia sp. RSA 2336]
MVESGQLIDDSFQRSIVAELDRLYQELLDYKPEPPAAPKKSPIDAVLKLFGKGTASSSHDKAEDSILTDAPRGLYIYGDVGTGKTTTMDLFYDTVPTSNKRRIHFHAFMLDIHARINAFKRTHSLSEDPIPTIARELASTAHVLCFDEFQVTDIADAMVLRRLTTELFRNNVVIVTTSNRHPDELYKNGIQRESFLPCIKMLKQQCQVVSLDSGTDYRKLARETESVYFSPIDADTNKVLHALFALAADNVPAESKKLSFLGRSLTVPLAANGVAKFSFSQLCKDAHGSADYIELARHFHTLILTDVPRMDISDRNEARRFITLIDALYESHSVLIMSSEASIYQLFSASSGANAFETQSALSADSAPESLVGYAGEEEVFAFQRAVSRLVEMSSKNWIIRSRNQALAQNALRQERDSEQLRSQNVHG